MRGRRTVLPSGAKGRSSSVISSRENRGFFRGKVPLYISPGAARCSLLGDFAPVERHVRPVEEGGEREREKKKSVGGSLRPDRLWLTFFFGIV